MPAKKSRPLEKLSPSTNKLQGLDIVSIQNSFVNHLEFSLAKDEYSATKRDCYKALAYTVRDRLVERWIETQQTYYKEDAKRVYYLSMEYLPGRLLGDALINLGLYENVSKALDELGYDIEELREMEFDAGLGNGGLGRLAACFMESLATLEIPAYGYGLRYEYGIFNQKIDNGMQVETPDAWLRYGNPGEIERPEYIYLVQFYGRINHHVNGNGQLIVDWVDTEDVVAMAYDTPIPGYRNNTVNNLRLWAAKSTRDFDLNYFNHGDYFRAVDDKIHSETISKVLYPRDDSFKGKELRLKQEYLLVSATLQDIVRRFKKTHGSNFELFADKVAIQLNDTHPALAIPELMRLLVDKESIGWDKSWEVTRKVCAYTNHTVLAEALEKWSVDLLTRLLPRHIEIIYEINRRLLDEVEKRFPNDDLRKRRMSLIEESDSKNVRMANLAIAGSHSVNGVAALHTQILKRNVFKDFFELKPEKFNNKTNGITQRRWLLLCNPALAQLIKDSIGDKWIKDLNQLKELKKFAGDSAFQEKFHKIKNENKSNLAKFIKQENDITVDPESLFDCQTKRFHEYKRQLLNIMRVIALYNKIRSFPNANYIPRTIIFSGKAAPGYYMAKLTIKLINSVADVINNDTIVKKYLKVVFLANYTVSLAQRIIPAANLSEQISTAGMEASGTGNMKYALNGALTIGTLDGANIEIMEEVGRSNIFIFGLKSHEVIDMREHKHDPWLYMHSNPELKQVIDQISNNHFSPNQPELFKPIIETLFAGDYYMTMADFQSYCQCQQKVDDAFADQSHWNEMAITNTLNMGKFSSDRSISQYVKEIWHAKPIKIKLGQNIKKRG